MTAQDHTSFVASIIIPAHNEEAYIADCLRSVEAQQGVPGPVEVLVMANACRDGTVAQALRFKQAFRDKGWTLRVLRTRRGGKVSALNCADKIATGSALIFLDADVTCDPDLAAELCAALATDAPCYASGALQVAPAKTWVTRQFAKIWVQVPFMQSKAVGAGLFSMNRAGRARWGTFPDIISDDTFVRLQFTPEERVEVPSRYHWPLVEGFGALVRVRRRQDAGVKQIAALYPDLIDNEAKPPLKPGKLFARNPVSFVTYCAVLIAVKLGKQGGDWSRGR